MEQQLLAIGYDEESNWIKLPQNILEDLIDKKIEFPFYFSVESSLNIINYFGVKEFTADDSVVLIPNKSLNNMCISGSDIVTVKLLEQIPKGYFINIEPLDKEIFDIPDLDLFLESVFSKYCLLWTNQIIEINWLDNIYSILIKEVKTEPDFDYETNIIEITNIDIKIELTNNFIENSKIQEIPKIEENIDNKIEENIDNKIEENRKIDFDFIRKQRLLAFENK